jgi:translocation and assembly module TamB
MPTSVALPLRVSIDRAAVGEMEIVSGESRLTLRDIALAYEGDSRAHHVRSLRVATDWGSLEATGELSTRDPFALTANAVFRQTPNRVAKLALSGTLERIDAKSEVELDDIRAQAEALLRPFDALWLEKLDASARGVDLARLVEDAPGSDVSVSVSAASQNAQSVAGTLQASNATAGALDEGRLPAREVRVDFVTDLRTAHLDPIEIEMSGSGRLTGSGELVDSRATLALVARAINLQGIYAPLLATALDGRIDASIAGSGEMLRAELTQGPLAIHLDGTRSGSELVVREARITARSHLRGIRSVGVGQLSGGESEWGARVARRGSETFRRAVVQADAKPVERCQRRRTWTGPRHRRADPFRGHGAGSRRESVLGAWRLWRRGRCARVHRRRAEACAA